MFDYERAHQPNILLARTRKQRRDRGGRVSRISLGKPNTSHKKVNIAIFFN